MTFSKNALRRSIVLLACALAVLSCAGPAAAAQKTFTAASTKDGVVSFTLRGLQPRTVRSATVRVGRYSRRIRAATIRRAARRGRIRVRVPRASLRRASSSRRKAPKLVVVVQPPSTSEPAPAPSGGSTLLAPRARILSDGDAAALVRRSTFEPRPENYTANHRVPTASELTNWRSVSNYRGVDNGLFLIEKVTGNFTGTTDEILQWAAHKWGIDEEMLRAQAVQESTWRQSAVGDGGISYGLLQLKSTIQRGTLTLARDSTAFNADYAMMTLRQCYDGDATWLGNGYRAGDMWGCLGYYYSGNWYDAGAQNYIASVKTHLAERAWAKAGF